MSTAIAPAEYVTYFDSSNVPAVTDAWTLTSPDTTVWGPAITTAGIVSFTSGAIALAVSVVFAGLDGNRWTPTIADTGIVTVTSGSVLSSAETLGTLTDSDGVIWTVYVDDTNQVKLTTSSLLPTEMRYPALVFSYTPASNTDRLLLHSSRVNLTIRRLSA